MDQNELINMINNVGNDVTGNVDISLKNDNDEYHVVKIPLMKPRVEELETLQKDYGIDITEERWDDIDKHTDVVYLIGLMKIKFLIDVKEDAWDILDKYREEILNEMSFDDICQLTGFDVGMGRAKSVRKSLKK